MSTMHNRLASADDKINNVQHRLRLLAEAERQPGLSEKERRLAQRETKAVQIALDKAMVALSEALNQLDRATELAGG